MLDFIDWQHLKKTEKCLPFCQSEIKSGPTGKGSAEINQKRVNLFFRFTYLGVEDDGQGQ